MPRKLYYQEFVDLLDLIQATRAKRILRVENAPKFRVMAEAIADIPLGEILHSEYLAKSFLDLCRAQAFIVGSDGDASGFEALYWLQVCLRKRLEARKYFKLNRAPKPSVPVAAFSPRLPYKDGA